MAVTLLVLANDPRQDQNSLDELATRYQKGSIITARPAAWTWGSQEGLPNFVRVTISDATYKQALSFLGQWTRQSIWTVVPSDLSTDVHSVKLTTALIGSTQRAGFSLSDVQGFLERWNATNIAIVNGEATFTLDIFEALRSQGFWNSDVSSVTFTQDSYDETTGDHTITASLPASISLNDAINAIIVRGGDILTADAAARTVQYQMDRDDVQVILKKEINKATLKTVAKARYYLPPATVDQIVSLGGTITRTKAQFLAVVQDNAA